MLLLDGLCIEIRVRADEWDRGNFNFWGPVVPGQQQHQKTRTLKDPCELLSKLPKGGYIGDDLGE